jgi:hypothetical protein
MYNEAPLPTYKRLGKLQEELVPIFRGEFLRIKEEASNITKHALAVSTSYEEFLQYVSGPRASDGFYRDVCIAMFSGSRNDADAAAGELLQDNISDTLFNLFPDPFGEHCK